jgi:tyrosyl-tRNA synthetase
MASLDPSQKFALISKNLAELLNPELIERVLAERDLKVYWGTRLLLLFHGSELKYH